MRKRWMLMVSLAMLIGTQGVGFGDWKSRLATKAVGEVAREGFEDAVEDAAKDAAFDAALGRASRRAGGHVSHARVGSAASAGIKSAMTAADVGHSMDNALDAAEAAKRANKARKAINKVR